MEKTTSVDAQIVLRELGQGNSSDQLRQKNRLVNKEKAVVVNKIEMDDSESDDSNYSIGGIHFDDSEDERDLGDNDDDGLHQMIVWWARNTRKNSR